MQRAYAAAAAAAIFAGTLCTPAAAQAPDEDMPSMGDLIAVAFPKWSDDTEGRLQTIAQTRATRTWPGLAPSKAARRKVLVEPVLVMRPAPGRFVLLATMLPAGDDGVAEWSADMPAGLAAYTFAPGASGWKLLRRQEPFELKGYEGAVRIEPVRLSGMVQGLVAEYGSCWKGACGRWLSVYEIGKDGVKPAAIADLPLAADNPAAGYGVAGRWSVEEAGEAPGAFVVDYSGRNGAQSIAQSLRYVWRGASYEVGSGSNPVPKL